LEERGNQHIYEENNMQKGGLDTKPINAFLDELSRKEIQEESRMWRRGSWFELTWKEWVQNELQARVIFLPWPR
jgi:hypothetical protein